jgi:dTDP-D-glucose 4,6-dehydratase
MERIHLAGSAGFIGSNFIRYLLSYTDRINLDKLTWAGDLGNIYCVIERTKELGPTMRRELRSLGKIASRDEGS